RDAREHLDQKGKKADRLPSGVASRPRARGILVRKRPQEYEFDGAENRGVRSDPVRQEHHGGWSKCRSPLQHFARVLQIPPNGSHSAFFVRVSPDSVVVCGSGPAIEESGVEW